ncbi:hypothetical protein EVAR_76632_1 [Eumeta japonica]|uniref:GIY-YIG domain-containing protein n=1 Tax=Eumeta variegata TaxID=151549 RepID=A0A4C1T854_EUMVA|nr:hypothetical protein EVAR_76632_1 [Eumeta japonica]
MIQERAGRRPRPRPRRRPRRRDHLYVFIALARCRFYCGVALYLLFYTSPQKETLLLFNAENENSSRFGPVARRLGAITLLRLMDAVKAPPGARHRITHINKMKKADKSCLIYRIPGNCGKWYVGQTKQKLKARLRQHRLDCKPENVIRSREAALAEHHFSEDGHTFQCDNAEIMDTERN